LPLMSSCSDTQWIWGVTFFSMSFEDFLDIW
jgi:hypothetical protein